VSLGCGSLCSAHGFIGGSGATCGARAGHKGRTGFPKKEKTGRPTPNKGNAVGGVGPATINGGD
jgi:hypothetical protein